MSSSDSPPAGERPAPPAARGRHAAPGVPGHDSYEDSAHAQAQRLEQIKDFYLTAEAIGERNVDKHFDELLAQQRELIGEYFKQSGAGKPGDGRTGQAEAEPDAAPGREGPGREGPGHQAEPSRSASLIAEPPRVW